MLSDESREAKERIQRAERAERARSAFPLFPELRGLTWLEFLREELSDETAISFDIGRSGPITDWVDVRSKRGHITVSLSAEKMMACGNLWDRGVSAGELSSPSLADAVAFIRAALARDTPLIIIQTEMPCFRAFKAGLMQDKGAEAYLDYVWQKFLKYLQESSNYLSIAQNHALAQDILQITELRQLRPYTSHNILSFSRCLGYPFSYDCPSSQPIGEDQFQVYGVSGSGQWHEHPIGVGNAREAAQMLADALPPHCGPAILGTVDDLED